MKSITVSDEVWQQLTIMKAEKMAPDLNDVVEKLIEANKK